jgi:hypothetical protein
MKIQLARPGARKSSVRKDVAEGHPSAPALHGLSSRIVSAASKAVAPTLPPDTPLMAKS